jgi:hypothetical protein
MMWPKRFEKPRRDLMLALVGVAVFGFASLITVPRAIDASEQFAIADDPVKISDRALDRFLNREVAEQRIQTALADHDVDCAQSILDLAMDRGIAIDEALTDKVKDARENEKSVTNKATQFVHGFWTGDTSDLTSLSGAFASDLFVFGDARDLAREGTHYITGQQYDPWVLGLASAGIAVTAATYFTLGAGAPERVGVSLLKVARRTDRLNPVLLTRITREFVNTGKTGRLVEAAADVGRIETKAGTQAALDSLKIAESPEDLSRLARLASAKGTRTRAILRLLGPAAITLAVGVLDVSMWLFWAAVMLLGFALSCKAAVERMTLRYIRWRKACRVRQAELRLLAVPARL